MNYTKHTPALMFYGFLSIFVMFAYMMWQMPRDFRKGIMPKITEIQKQNERLHYRIDIIHAMLRALEN